MITFTQLSIACWTYPNDQELGAFVRALYLSEKRRIKALTEEKSNG